MTKDETQIPATNEQHGGKQNKKKVKNEKDNSIPKKNKKGGLRSRSRSASKMSPKNNG